MSMRSFINAVVPLTEAIVYRDRFVQEYNDRKTVVALNPTKQEWDTAFPRGAAGVYLKDGRVVVGDGNCLAHHDIMDYAKIAPKQEKYRLQICRTGAWVELWMSEEWDNDYETKGRAPTKKEVLEQVERQYGEPIEQIEAQVKGALQKFMGNVPVRVVPLRIYDQEGYLAADRAFVKRCIADHRKMCGT